MSSQFFSKHPMSSAPPSLVSITNTNGVSLNTINGLLQPFKNQDENLIALINGNQTSINQHLALINTNDARLDTLEPIVESLSNSSTTHSSQISTIQNDVETNTQSITDILTNKQDVLSSNNKLPISSVNLTGNSLSYVDISSSLSNSLSNVNTSINNINNQITTINNTATSQSTSITTLIANDVAINSNISALETETSNLQSSKMNVIDENNLLPSSFVSINEGLLTDKITAMDTAISSKQSLITPLNKIPVSNINLTGSSLAYVDINSSLSNTLSGMNNAISVLTGLQEGDETSLVNINNSISALEEGLTDANTLINTKQDVLTTNSIPISYVSNLQTNLNNLSNSISTLQGLQDGDISSFASINLTITEIQGNISTIETNVSNNENSINQVQSNLDAVELAKQDVLSSNNKLSASFLDISSSALRFVDITAPLKNQIDTINTSITNINGINTTQLTTNNSITTSISNINTLLEQQGDAIVANADAIDLKQNIIDGSNKLPISSVNLTGNSLSYVDISSSLQTQLNSINSSLSSHNTSISNHSTNITNLQSADALINTSITNLEAQDVVLQENIDLKQDEITSSNLLESNLINCDGDVLLSDKITSLETSIASNTSAIATKQPILTNNSVAISYVTNLQTTLTNLSNSISTLQGLQDGDITSFQNIQDQIDTANTLINTKQDILTNNSVAISYVTNLQTTLTNLSNSISTLQGLQDGDITSFQTINDTITDIQGDISTIQINISNNETATALVQSNLDDVSTSLTASIATKMPIIDINNKLNSSFVNYSASALRFVNISSNLQEIIDGINDALTLLQQEDTDQNALNNTITTDITALQNGKQNLITSGSKLASSLVSYNGSSVSASLDAVIIGISQNSTDILSLTAEVASNKTASDTAEATLTTNVNTLSNSLNTLSTNVTNINNTLTGSVNTLTADLTDLETIVTDNQTSNTASLNTLTDDLNTLTDDLNTLSTNTTNSLTSLETQITDGLFLKQNTITTESKLNASLVDFSSSNIRFADTTSSVNGLINTINTSISSQATTISNHTTSINDLETNIDLKQDIINGSNLLSANYVNTSGDILLSDKLVSLTNEIGTKQDTITTESKLSANLVDFSSSSIRFADTNSSIQGLINTANSNITTNTNSISTLNSSVSTLQSADIIHDGQITDLQDGLLLKQDIIDGSNLLPASFINTAGDILLSTKLSNIDTAIAGKQSTLNNTNNKLAIDKVDLTGSSLVYCDINSSLSTQLTNINNTIGTITALDEDQTQALIALTDSIALKHDLIDTNNKLPSTLVSYNGTNVSATILDLQDQIDNISVGGLPSLSYDTNTTTTTITNTTLLTNLKFSGDNSIQNTAFTSSKNTELSTASSNITTIQGDISTLQSGKHPLINAGAKLNSNVVSYGASNVSADLDQIHTDISALQSSDTAQTSSLSNLTDAVNDLTTDKQDLITNDNKIVSDYVSYNGSNVKLTLDDIISLKAPLANPTFTGSVSGITKAMVGLGNCDNVSDANKSISTATQTALDLKSNIDNPVFTTKIETPQIKITTGAGANKVLTSDANGDATWNNPASSGASIVLVNSGNTTNGTYEVQDNTQTIFIKQDAFINSKYTPVYPLGSVSVDLNSASAFYDDVANNRVIIGFKAPLNYCSSLEVDNVDEYDVSSALWVYNKISKRFIPVLGGPTGEITCICYSPASGYYYIGGNFTTLNQNSTGLTCNRLCKMDTSLTCTTIGSGFNNYVYALEYSSFDNKVYVGGSFTTAGGTSSNYGLASISSTNTYGYFNGTAMAGGYINNISANTINGDIYLFGTFTAINAVSVFHCAKCTTAGVISAFSGFAYPNGGSVGYSKWVSPYLWIVGNQSAGHKINRWDYTNNSMLNPNVGAFNGYSFNCFTYKNGFIYAGGSGSAGANVYAGLTGQANLYNATGNIATFNCSTYAMTIIRTPNKAVNAIMMDNENNLWSAFYQSNPLVYYTLDYYKVFYNNKTLGLLVGDCDALRVDTKTDGADKYASVQKLIGYKN